MCINLYASHELVKLLSLSVCVCTNVCRICCKECTCIGCCSNWSLYFIPVTTLSQCQFSITTSLSSSISSATACCALQHPQQTQPQTPPPALLLWRSLPHQALPSHHLKNLPLPPRLLLSLGKHPALPTLITNRVNLVPKSAPLKL